MKYTLLILVLGVLACSKVKDNTSPASKLNTPSERVKNETKVNPKQWPDTDPPDFSDPHWEFNNNENVNGVQYKKKRVGEKWQWVVDEEAMKWMAKREQHRRNLFWALRSRVLTDSEMKEVVEYGSYLNVEPEVGYSQADKDRELNEALLQQQRLRLQAQELKAK